MNLPPYRVSLYTLLLSPSIRQHIHPSHSLTDHPGNTLALARMDAPLCTQLRSLALTYRCERQKHLYRRYASPALAHFQTLYPQKQLILGTNLFHRRRRIRELTQVDP